MFFAKWQGKQKLKIISTVTPDIPITISRRIVAIEIRDTGIRSIVQIAADGANFISVPLYYFCETHNVLRF
jgi:hypothetical protein